MIRKLARYIRDSSSYTKLVSSKFYQISLQLSDLISLRISSVLPFTTESNDNNYHLLLAPTGGGNIGDQALFESFLDKTEGPIKVLATSHGSLNVPSQESDRVSILTSSGALYLPPMARMLSMVRISNLIKRSKSCSVIGADLMDGLYNPAASIARASILWMGASLDKPTVLIGCSWAENALPSCAHSLKRASKAGAIINARDEISQKRMVKDGIKKTRLVADLVFAMSDSNSPTPADRFIENERAQGKSIAILNLSGLIGRKIDQTSEYELIANYLLERGYSIILLPHVFRATGDDLSECAKLFDKLNSERVMFIREQLPPRTIRSIAGQADQIITGRMHLAVLSLSKRRMPITLGTHGKVEGMYMHFEEDRFCVLPEPGFSKQTLDCIEKIENLSIDWDKYLLDTRLKAMNNLTPLPKF